MLGSERGDTLIEVLISAVLLAVIVVGMLSALDSTNRSSALQRARSEADALAQQSQDQLRGEPIKRLYELESKPETRAVTANGTVYTIETTAAYVQDATATSSCTSSAAKADYLRTASKVTWPSLGPGKPVIETSVVSPPAGAALIVQVTESGAAPVTGATATATGPAPETATHSLETSASGCAILALAPGEYSFNVSKAGYVTPNGFANTSEDEGSSVTHSAYIPAETTAKEGYYLARPGKLSVAFSGGQNDTFMAFNTGMTNSKVFGTVGTLVSSLASPTQLYPFPTKYTVYAGSCESDKPAIVKPENEVLVPTTGTGSTTLALPPVKLSVYSGKSAVSPGTLVAASASLKDEGCGTTRTFTTASGATFQVGMPYGNYSLCVTAKVGAPAKQRRYVRASLHNATSAGLSETVYLESAEESALTSCP